MTFKAHVHNGRLVLDEPTSLPEGATVDLVALDDWADDLDEEETRHLDEALPESEDDVKAGRVHTAADVVAELRRV
jgi:hypothetical protein